MQIKLADGDQFPRGICRVSLLGPCCVCGHRYMDNHPDYYPVWSSHQENLVCRSCWNISRGVLNNEKRLTVIELLDRELDINVAEGFSTDELLRILGHITEMQTVLDTLIFSNEMPCDTDVSGYCRTHDWKRNEGCPVGRAQKLLEGAS